MSYLVEVAQNGLVVTCQDVDGEDEKWVFSTFDEFIGFCEAEFGFADFSVDEDEEDEEDEDSEE